MAIICRPVRRAMPPGMLSPGFCRTVLVSEVHRHSATGHNGPEALFVLWKDNTTPGKLLVKEITS